MVITYLYSKSKISFESKYLLNYLFFIFFKYKEVENGTYQIWWSGESMSFTRTSLAITKCCTTKTFNCHFNNTLNTRIIQYIFLSCARFKNNIIRKYTYTFTITTSSRIVTFNLKLLSMFILIQNKCVELIKTYNYLAISRKL